MEVELDSSLLTAQPRDDLVLLAICAFGLLGRHRIVPDDRAAWDRWARTLPGELAEEVLFAWDESERRASEGGPSERVAVVPTGPARFGQVPIELTPTEAFALLGRPLRVLLENGRNDRAFLLAFADEATRRALDEAERHGWVVFETAGGINELAQRIEAVQDSASREVFRTMYLCDSDATQPGAYSQVADAVRQNLTVLTTTFQRQPSHFGFVLSRRAAENYAPPGAVLTWARDGFGRDAWRVIQRARTPAERATLAIGTGAEGSWRRRLLAAIALTELHADVRGFVDMKEGRLRRNRPPQADVVRTVDSVWNTLDAFQQAALLDGFGAGFSASFYGSQRCLQDETGEVKAFLAKIMERI
ncbi:hypothetical protein WME89_12855 [Sorangium sp. So ce321]|uniref:hypothetical protein n=1 Tax=Sorangium sp. So ce321 TaxID=3133300 RepID=UPI003F605D78